MKNFSTLLLVIHLLLVGCSSKSDWKGQKEIKEGVVYMHNSDKGLWNEKAKIELKNLLTIGAEDMGEDYLLVRPFSLVVDKSNNIYICDNEDHCIKKYTAEGQFLAKISKKGEGPEELYSPVKIAITDDMRLCVLSENKISYFSLEGEFIDCRRIQDFKSWDMAILSGHASVFISQNFTSYTTPSEGFNFVFFEIGQGGKILNRFGEPAKKGVTSSIDVFSSAFLSTSAQNEIITTFIESPIEIRIYDSKIKHHLTITRDSEIFDNPQIQKIHISGDKYIEKLIARGQLGRAMVFPDNKIFVGIIDFGRDFMEKRENNDFSFKTMYDLYDSAGRYLQTFFWSPNGKEFFAHIDRDGYIYSFSGPDQVPQVKKYKIAFVNK